MTRPSGMPGRDCPRCPRLVEFRHSWRQREPGWFNAPVDSFGPGQFLRGCYRRVDVSTAEFGFARGHYAASANDGFELIDCRITNAVRCVPPDNKPTPQEINTCRDFLKTTMAEMSKLRAVVALGRIAHESFVAASGERRAQFPFAHSRAHTLPTVALIAHAANVPRRDRPSAQAHRRGFAARPRSHAVTCSAFSSGGKTG